MNIWKITNNSHNHTRIEHFHRLWCKRFQDMALANIWKVDKCFFRNEKKIDLLALINTYENYECVVYIEYTFASRNVDFFPPKKAACIRLQKYTIVSVLKSLKVRWLCHFYFLFDYIFAFAFPRNGFSSSNFYEFFHCVITSFGKSWIQTINRKVSRKLCKKNYILDIFMINSTYVISKASSYNVWTCVICVFVCEWVSVYIGTIFLE